MNAQVVVGVGMDRQPAADIGRAIPAFSQRYLDRIYTDSEQRLVARQDRPSALGFAGRFAAKEAVLKALGVADGIDPRWVEVLASESGEPIVILHEGAQQVAAQLGVCAIRLSIAYQADNAHAVAVTSSDGDSACDRKDLHD